MFFQIQCGNDDWGWFEAGMTTRGMMKKILFYLLIIILPVLPVVARGGGGFIEKSGDVLTLALPAYALGMAVREDGWTGTMQFGGAYLATVISTSELQKLTHAPRPNGGKNGFPSGHASSAFSAATFIHKRYGWKQAIAPYALAAWTGYSRIHSDWHYFYQVAGGAAVAGLYTWLLVGRMEAPAVMVSPTLDGGVRADFNVKF
ncbi:MAG: phosphatase PAP2 family protein [Rickettsiales bacterium]|jgi:membrane-associated phospholipid phosphatase|nr:phosphatase PAP2 family protein [Rickettsiales bacterium]